MSIRADVHNATGLCEYVAGMARSKPDKAKILEFVTGNRVLELGCGSGSVLELLQNHDQNIELVGVDLSAKLIGAAAKQLGDRVRFHRQDIFELCKNPDKLNEPKFSSVILCSALHEFATFALEHPERFFEAGVSPMLVAAKQIFGLAKSLLQPGGRLIVRDGVKLEAQLLQVRFNHPELQEIFWRFSDDFRPFKLEFAVQGNTYTMQASHFYEFATKYFYATNWDIEVGEIFGWASGVDLETLLLETGFTPETRQVYTIDFLQNKWENAFEMTDQNGMPFMLPSTQIISARA